MSIKKVGGLHHWRIGRLGGSFYLAKAKPSEGPGLLSDLAVWTFFAACTALAAAPHLI